MMTAKPTICVEIEPDLVAAATGDAAAAAARRVEDHVGRCAPCRRALERYRAIDGVLGGLRRAPLPEVEMARSRETLESRLADLRSRVVAYRVFSSPLGRILIARSEQGVSLVEYLGGGRGLGASRLSHVPGVEPQEDGAEIETLYRDLVDYLEGRRRHLDWPLDLRLARSDFHRAVLAATATIPYGAVTSYAGIARDLGKPAAVRAVAQALRWNPLPIVVPCHRVIGSTGSLTGYAGNRVSLKQRLLAVEGVRTLEARGELRVARHAMYASPWGEVEYCLPTCGSLPQQTLAELRLFGSRERAEATGLRPCTTCRPDLHPLAA